MLLLHVCLTVFKAYETGLSEPSQDIWSRGLCVYILDIPDRRRLLGRMISDLPRAFGADMSISTKLVMECNDLTGLGHRDCQYAGGRCRRRTQVSAGA